MNLHHLTISVALVLLLLAGAVSSAEAKHVSCTFAETFSDGVETHIDTNGDGISATLAQGLVNCNIGRFLQQEEDEFQAPLPAPVTCPAGTQESHVQQVHGVSTEEKTGDQLFLEVATGASTLCFNLSDLTFSFTTHGTFAGGTGQFTGASGSFDAQGTGKLLVVGFKNGVLGDLGQFSATSTGTLILPKGEEDGQGGD